MKEPAKGFYFCELAEYYTREANDEVQMLKLLYQSLRALCKPSVPDELIRSRGELKVLVGERRVSAGF
ncbi:MAG: DNA repair protein RecO C-terminal domain-containing protein [Anaerosacchariphilus sp.]